MPRERTPSFEELLKPLPFYSPKSWFYHLSSLLLRTVGTLSEGIRISYAHGFDSGILMNYVYRNTPQGRLHIGEILDRAFLNQVTCKAFRAIKEIQKNAIINYLNQRNGQPTFIADLASGKADYLYEALKETDANVKILLRDIEEGALVESKAMAEKMGLLNKVSYQLGNALDIASLKTIKPQPNLVIEVGLYGIIHDDELVKKHFVDLRENLNPEAILFNVQTYNPQIEFIARVFNNQDGERCVWHLRPAELVIGWAEEAGFREPKVTMDPYGIYAVVSMKN